MDLEIEFGRAGERSKAPSFEMPAPTLQPLVLALGLLLVFTGYIFLPLISYIGFAITLAAAAGWAWNVIPHEKHEWVPLEVKHRPSPIAQRNVPVMHLVAVDRKSDAADERIPFGAGVAGGLAGGLVMAVLACAYGLVAHGSIWYAVNLLAAVVMPAIAQQGDAQLNMFNPVGAAFAGIGHLGLSILVGVLYAVMLPMFPRRAPLWAGVLLPLVWTALVGTVLHLVNPALNAHINWPSYIACQVAFGMVCGFVVARLEHIDSLRDLSLAERAFLHAPAAADSDKPVGNKPA